MVGDGIYRSSVRSTGARVAGIGVRISSCIFFFCMPGVLGLLSPGSMVLAGVVGIRSSINVGIRALLSLTWYPGGSGAD